MERSFRLAGLGLLLLCVAKIFAIDVWGLDPQSRYITLIVLGGLAGAGFVSLHTAQRETAEVFVIPRSDRAN